jgi:hypothetical protein
MKTKFKFPVFVVTVLLLAMGSLLIQGCEPEPIPGPPPIQPKVELTVAPSGILPYGAYCTVTWSSTDARTLTLNNKQTTLSGSVTNRLFRDTIFEVVARNEPLSAKAEKEIKVGDWTTSKLGLITHAPWYYTSVKFYRDGILLFESPLSEEERKDQHVYSVEGKHSVYRSGIRIGYMDWIFSQDENSITYAPNTQGPSTYTISHLSEKKFIITQVSTYADGLPCLGEATFERK